jgi:hypothetical protein
MNYTKGKWYTISGGFVDAITNGTTIPIEVATIHGENQEGDAQLISAAPDMYEALKEVIDLTLFTDKIENVDWQKFRRHAVNALNKAEGK